MYQLLSHNSTVPVRWKRTLCFESHHLREFGSSRGGRPQELCSSHPLPARSESPFLVVIDFAEGTKLWTMPRSTEPGSPELSKTSRAVRFSLVPQSTSRGIKYRLQKQSLR